MKPSKLSLNVLTSYIVLMTLTLAALMTLPVVAQEADGPTRIEIELNETGVPILGHIPYVSKLFKNIGVADAHVICDNEGCQVISPTEPKITCPQPCCSQLAACAVSSGTAVQAFVPSAGGLEGVTKFELMSSLLEARSHAAALEAALEARERFEEQKEEIINSLAEATMRNAKLEAHTEILEHQLATQAEIAQTQLENVKLQAKLEFVSQREQIVKTHSQVLAENQRLKAQLAKLEKSYSGALAKKAKAAATGAYARKPKPPKAVKR